jgi:hypothetical protein
MALSRPWQPHLGDSSLPCGGRGRGFESHQAYHFQATTRPRQAGVFFLHLVDSQSGASEQLLDQLVSARWQRRIERHVFALGHGVSGDVGTVQGKGGRGIDSWTM